MRIWLIISHLGVGLLPGPKGTWGSALGVLLFALAEYLWPGCGGVALVIAATVLGTIAAHQAEKVWGHDSGRIIIDEVAGQGLTLLFAPLNPFTMILGFFLFRFFDILKCPPMSWAEKIKGGAGVVGDDLLAGFYAGVFLWAGWGLKTIFWPG
jgi:phosphatidylglycerophosphatase A